MLPIHVFEKKKYWWKNQPEWVYMGTRWTQEYVDLASLPQTENNLKAIADDQLPAGDPKTAVWMGKQFAGIQEVLRILS